MMPDAPRELPLHATTRFSPKGQRANWALVAGMLLAAGGCTSLPATTLYPPDAASDVSPQHVARDPFPAAGDVGL